jgi:PEP-CTERM motif
MNETPMNYSFRPSILAIVAVAVVSNFHLLRGVAIAADVTSSWSTATSGNWNANANWTNVPALGGFPNNSNGGVATYDAVINAAGSPYTVTLGTAVAVEDLLLNSANATLAHTAGTLTATGAINVSAGTYQLSGGTITDTTVNVTGGTLAITANSNNLLTGVTVNGDLTLNAGNARTKLAGSTTFNTAHLIESQSLLGIVPGYSLGGTISFEGPSSTSRAVVMDTTPGTFTVGPTGVMRTAAGFGGNVQIGGQFIFFGDMILVNNGLISSETSGRTVTVVPQSLTNNGTLSATGGGILTVNPTSSWTNGGTISINNGTLNLGGTFNATGGIGTWNNTAGTVNVAGSVNNTGSTLTLNNSTGSWTLAGGTISGGTVAFADGKTIAFAANGLNSLTGVAVNGDLTFSSNGARTKLAGGTTFHTAHLAGSTTALGFAPGETLASTVLLEGAATGVRLIEMSGASGTFTVGPTGTIRTAADLGGETFFGTSSAFGGTMTLVNQGLISSQTSGRTISINPNNPAAGFTNSGTLEAINGGSIAVALGYTQTAGVTRLSGGGTISASNAATLSTISVAGGRLEATGTIAANVANSATIAPGAPTGTLAITGDLTLAASSTLEIDLAGNIQGTGYDFVQEAGVAALDLQGALSLTLLNGFVPAAADSLIILSSSEPLTGAFSNIVNGRVTASDGITSLRVSVIGNHVVVGELPGDYNGNGVVDAADYVVWRKGLGTTHLPAHADIWRGQFGVIAGGGSIAADSAPAFTSVPEPTSLMLLALAGLFAAIVFARRNQPLLAS